MAVRRLEVEIIGDASSLERAFHKGGKAADSFGEKLHRGVVRGAELAGKAMLGGGLLMGVGLLHAANAAGDFQKVMNVLQATTGASSEKMGEMSKLAIQLGADVRLPATSAKDAADAMLELAKGGLSVSNAMSAAHGALTLSAAAGIPVVEAAGMMANSLNMFGLKGREATRVADLFAAGANATTASAIDFGYALEHVGATAHLLHIPIQDTTAALGELFNAGIKGATAGATLNMTLLRLVNPTRAAANVMRDLKLNLFDAKGHFVGLEVASGRMKTALKGLTDQQKLQDLAIIFGVRGMRGAAIVLGQGKEKYDAMRKAVEKAGAAQKLADAQTAGFKGAMSGLKSTLETVEIQVGLKLLPALTRFLRFLTDEVPKVSAVVIPALTNAFNAVKPAVVEVASVVLDLTKTLAGHGDIIGTVAIALGVIVVAIEAYKVAVVTATAIQWLLNLSLSANPVGVVVIAVAALVIGIIALYRHSRTAREVIDVAFGAIKEVASVALGFITDTILPAFSREWRTAKTVIGVLVDYFVGPFNVAFDAVKGVIKVVTDLLNGNFSKAWTDVKSTITNVFNDINDSLGGLPGKILGMVGRVSSAAVSLGSSIVTGIINGLGGLTDALIKAIQNAATSALSIVTGAISSGHGPATVGGHTSPRLPGKSHAMGGIVTRPEYSLIGEDGPEAIIPLSKPSRARQVMRQAGLSGGDGMVHQHFYAANQDPRALLSTASWMLRTGGRA